MGRGWELRNTEIEERRDGGRGKGRKDKANRMIQAERTREKECTHM